ncbi:MAG: iron-sulfur cluster assembly protein [Mesorhizobium sp.]
MTAAERVAQVQSVISAVRDPEIDETAGELDFVVGVEVAEGDVAVSIRLPSYWCPANFAWLMAQDMRKAVLSLPWATGFQLELVDHFADAQISRGVSEGLAFEAVFPAHAVGDLSQLKRDFATKAMLMRQAPLIAALRKTGMSDTVICAATIRTLDQLDNIAIVELGAALMQKRREAGIPHDTSQPAICDAEGAAITDLNAHMREIRRVSTSAAASGEMCRMLVAGRRIGVGCTASRKNMNRQENAR